MLRWRPGSSLEVYPLGGGSEKTLDDRWRPAEDLTVAVHRIRYANEPNCRLSYSQILPLRQESQSDSVLQHTLRCHRPVVLELEPRSGLLLVRSIALEPLRGQGA